MADLEATQTVLRALAHPVRMRMLSHAWRSPVSIADLARHVGIGHGLASQHVRTLRQAGLLRRSGHETRRGGVADLYQAERGTPITDLVTGADDITPLVATMAALMTERTARRTPGARSLAADAELRVPAEAWERYRDTVLAATQQLHASVVEAGRADAVEVGLTLLGFPLERRRA